MSKNGEILIETGDSCHLSPKYHHKPYYLPDHLSFANEEILVNILNKVGFKIIKIKKYPYFSPKKLELIPLLKDLLRLILGRVSSFCNYQFIYKFCDKFQSKDMWIRAKLVN